MNPGDLVEEMLAAPAAVAYLDVARASGLTPAQAADPVTALFLSAESMGLVNPWSTDRDAIGAALREAAAGLRDFARAVAEQPTLAAAWFAPVDPDRQVWIKGSQGGPPSPDRFVPPAEAVARNGRTWEAYAQKSGGGLYTCTVIGGVHPVLLGEPEGGIGDYHPPRGPAMWRLPVSEPVRVYEVRDAWDWHALCVAHPQAARETPGADDDPGLLAPDWPSVAAAWDAVHLTVGGVLLAEQRTVERHGRRTRHWAWEFEQTLWLRWAFSRPEPFTPRPAVGAGPDLQRPDWYWPVLHGGETDR